MPHDYIITDKNGNITNLSEHLAKEVGLHYKFFESNNAFSTLIKIDQLLPSLYHSLDHREQLTDGFITTFDTSSIIDSVNIDVMSQDEALHAISRQGCYNAHV